MNEPESCCAICTKSCVKELLGMLLSLAHHHPNMPIYIMADTYTKSYIEMEIPNVELKIKWIITLDKYSGKNRQQMERENIFREFLYNKANVISLALEDYNDTILLDCDLFILGKINNIDKTKELGVSPHYMEQGRINLYGYYNSGFLWTKNKDVPKRWIEYTKTSRFFEQASVEDIAREFSHFNFPKNYNFGQWRFHLDNKYVNIKDNKLMFENDELKVIHIHFHKYVPFRNLIINNLRLLNRNKEITFINRIINK